MKAGTRIESTILVIPPKAGIHMPRASNGHRGRCVIRFLYVGGKATAPLDPGIRRKDEGGAPGGLIRQYSG